MLGGTSRRNLSALEHLERVWLITSHSKQRRDDKETFDGGVVVLEVQPRNMEEFFRSAKLSLPKAGRKAG